MDWDYTDDLPGVGGDTLTVLGAEVAEVFYEDAKHRHCDPPEARPEALGPALAATRATVAGRVAQSWPGADGPPPAAAPLATLVHDAATASLGGGLSAGVELVVVTGDGRVARVVPGLPGSLPALALGPERRARFRAAVPGGRAGERSCTVVAVACPGRLVLAAREAGAACPLSRAYRRTLVEAGAVLEAVARGLRDAGRAVAPCLQLYDDDLHAALGLGGVSEVAVGALAVGGPA